MRLKSHSGKSSTFFQIEIGGWGDNLSQIRRGMQGDILTDAQVSQQGVVDRLVEFVWSEDVVGFDGCFFFSLLIFV